MTAWCVCMGVCMWLNALAVSMCACACVCMHVETKGLAEESSVLQPSEPHGLGWQVDRADLCMPHARTSL